MTHHSPGAPCPDYTVSTEAMRWQPAPQTPSLDDLHAQALNVTPVDTTDPCHQCDADPGDECPTGCPARESAAVDAVREALRPHDLPALCALWQQAAAEDDDEHPDTSAPVVIALYDEMEHRAGRPAIRRWTDAEQEQGRTLDPLPYLN
ncbi:hypothetical protein SRB5_53050 [Streptomyces sp. RB5]|uniref:Uncharacterized protein n=1 Tax=Streptomyces smaragdinus TaxID=2585196 RepID=A0A7K0CNR0_9ACTN|nr:hypothetical protein [Streptomyces smaragdinus]MQY15127.1 hypothetical protein [Streptomyces smaragdinus]